MSGSEAAVNDVQGAVSLSVRTKSLDHSSLSNDQIKSRLSELNGTDYHISLPSGEQYSGSLVGNSPEGSGTYTWSDGSKYEGQWRFGVRHGYGKLQWPSGAFYEGEFSGGYINGSGLYTRSDRAVYNGRWRLNLKHGLGYQTYPNGDIFEGSWIKGAPQGHGKYTWTNGNVYMGNVNGGKISGKGTLTWTNGDSYEGSWLDGHMHGFGVYTWVKLYGGGTYVGTWTRGLKDGKGTFYPKGRKILESSQQMYLNALRKRGLLPDLRKQNNNNRVVNNVSLERRWSMSEIVLEGGVDDDDEMMNMDLDMPILEREYMQGVLISELVLSDRFCKRREKRLAREIKRPGEQIIKGHRSYDLMLSLQLGIRYSVGRITPIPMREVRTADFDPRSGYIRSFPKEGSPQTPPHQSEDFKWKDYCPIVFRNLRAMFKIDVADYMMSICGNDALRELSSPGKSGSIFFMSQDDRFMIKTLRKSEVKVLLRMLQNYHLHQFRYENTLLTKFFGLHRIIPSSGQKFRFVVMGNMFCTELRIHRRFDLKGSSLGRSANKVEIDENTILKDLDLNYCFYLEPSWRDSLLQQIEIDSKFLESEQIMDYSLLLGIHYRAPQNLRYGLGIVAEDEDEISPRGLVLVPRGSDDVSVIVGSHIRGSRLRATTSSTFGDEEVDLLLPGTARLQIQLGVNMPARAEHIPGKDGGSTHRQMFHEAYDVVLYLGIIDILQEYNTTKKIEHAYKSVKFDSVSISAVDPAFYSRRFLGFIKKVFPPNSVVGLV
ncbi:hypothetical protein ABFS83_12G144600 [Erythranthe nasuta]